MKSPGAGLIYMIVKTSVPRLEANFRLPAAGHANERGPNRRELG